MADGRLSRRELLGTLALGGAAALGSVARATANTPEWQFQKQGLGKNLKLVHLPDMDAVSYSSTLWLVNRAPHPGAAKLFINWLLTRDAQIHWAREVEQNSRRIGVEAGNPHLLPPKGAKLFQVDAEENLPEVIKTQDIAKAIIK